MGKKQTYCQGHQWQRAIPTKGMTQDHILEALGARTAGLDHDKRSALRQLLQVKHSEWSWRGQGEGSTYITLDRNRPVP